MINLLLGAPGGGKSYEAVAYHVLPALKRGRKVITNLPLNLEAFSALDPDYPALIELRTGTLALPPADCTGEDNAGGLLGLIHQARAAKFDKRAFANVEDFASDWRNADGMGPLYIIDECHFVMPRVGTSRAVEEWFSMHRHFNADVLLITQSSGKISMAIRDLIQVCYKVRKAIAFGKSDSYMRKVLDGVGGGEVSVSLRKYRAEIYKLYRSHTQGQAVGEAEADDVKPFIVRFKRMTWIVLGVGILASTWFVFGLINKKTPVVRPMSLVRASSPAESGVVASPPVRPASSVSRSPAPVAPGPAIPVRVLVPSSEVPEPFQNKGLHLTGRISMGGKTVYMFAISQNGYSISQITSLDLVKAGYRWEPLTDCAGTAIWKDKAFAVTCDSPQISMGSQAAAPAVASTVAKPVTTL